jgi:hypothetical protein
MPRLVVPARREEAVGARAKGGPGGRARSQGLSALADWRGDEPLPLERLFGPEPPGEPGAIHGRRGRGQRGRAHAAIVRSHVTSCALDSRFDHSSLGAYSKQGCGPTSVSGWRWGFCPVSRWEAWRCSGQPDLDRKPAPQARFLAGARPPGTPWHRAHCHRRSLPMRG